METRLCDYGCGLEAKYKMTSGKWWRLLYE
jgi:hypothetical protein